MSNFQLLQGTCRGKVQTYLQENRFVCLHSLHTEGKVFRRKINWSDTSTRNVCFSHFGSIDIAVPSFRPVLSLHKHAQVHVGSAVANQPCHCKPSPRQQAQWNWWFSTLGLEGVWRLLATGAESCAYVKEKTTTYKNRKKKSLDHWDDQISLKAPHAYNFYRTWQLRIPSIFRVQTYWTILLANLGSAARNMVWYFTEKREL